LQDLPCVIAMMLSNGIPHRGFTADRNVIQIAALKSKPRKQVVVTRDRIVEVDTDKHSYAKLISCMVLML
jgi:hypothetical protein